MSGQAAGAPDASSSTAFNAQPPGKHSPAPTAAPACCEPVQQLRKLTAAASGWRGRGRTRPPPLPPTAPPPVAAPALQARSGRADGFGRALRRHSRANQGRGKAERAALAREKFRGRLLPAQAALRLVILVAVHGARELGMRGGAREPPRQNPAAHARQLGPKDFHGCRALSTMITRCFQTIDAEPGLQTHPGLRSTTSRRKAAVFALSARLQVICSPSRHRGERAVGARCKYVLLRRRRSRPPPAPAACRRLAPRSLQPLVGVPAPSSVDSC